MLEKDKEEILRISKLGWLSNKDIDILYDIYINVFQNPIQDKKCGSCITEALNKLVKEIKNNE